jgi:hypothetical protein
MRPDRRAALREVSPLMTESPANRRALFFVVAVGATLNSSESTRDYSGAALRPLAAPRERDLEACLRLAQFPRAGELSLMLTLYVDDSGKPDQSPVQVLAGYLSTAERWASFSKEWQQLLDDAGLDAFRMSEAWRLARKYQHKGSLNRDHLIVRAVECIKRHVEMAFVSSIPFDGFSRHLDVAQDHSHPLGRPYFYGFYALLTQVYQHAFEKRANQPLEVIFDEQGGESSQYVLSAMDQFRKLAGEHFTDLVIPRPHFQNDKRALPIQAADLLAWLVRRDAVNARRRVDRSKRLENLILGEALSMPNSIVVWDEKRLEFASNHLLATLQALIERAS